MQFYNKKSVKKVFNKINFCKKINMINYMINVYNSNQSVIKAVGIKDVIHQSWGSLYT